MKKISKFCFLATLSLSLTSCLGEDYSVSKFEDLVISEYVEGSGYNKAIEIFNGTDKAIDLNGYSIDIYMNNDELPTKIYLSDDLLVGETYTYVYESDESTIDTSDIGKFSYIDTNFNGDDEIVLSYKDNLVDIVGNRDGFSKTNDKYLDNRTLRRKLYNDPGYYDKNYDEFDSDDFSHLGKGVYDISYEGIDSTIVELKENRTLMFEQGTNVDNIIRSQFYIFDYEYGHIVDNNIVFDTSNIDINVIGSYPLTINVDLEGSIKSFNFTVEITEEYQLPTNVINYYTSVNGLTGSNLKNGLNDLISGHTEYPYTDSNTDVWDILRDIDEDPNNPNNVLTLYTNESISKDCQDGSSSGECPLGTWNREHVWSKSRGDFGTSLGAGTDAHHLYAANKTMNSTKNNRFFENCNDGDDTNIVGRDNDNYTCNEWEFEPHDDVKGDIARMIFYMAVRYEGENGEVDLEISLNPLDDKNSKEPLYGNLEDLLNWHYQDPVSQRERTRNDKIQGYLGNRNPFIDYPTFVSEVFE